MDQLIDISQIKEIIAPYIPMLTKYIGSMIVITFVTWGIITLFEKRLKIKLHTRIKAVIPIVLGVAYYFVFIKMCLAENIVYGIILGCVTSSAYEIIVHKLFALFNNKLDKKSE